MRAMLILAGALTTGALPLAAQLQEADQEAIADFLKADPSIRYWLDNAHGYAVFASVGKGAIGVGGAHGSGRVYQGDQLVGKTTLTQVTIGFQLGGQAFREIIFFKDETALDDFRRGNFELSAQASAVAVTAGKSADIAYSRGVAIITIAKGGLMYEASVGGQKFSFEPVERP